MARKTSDAYYENGNLNFKDNMQPKPQVKTSSEFQAIIIHYDKVVA